MRNSKELGYFDLLYTQHCLKNSSQEKKNFRSEKKWVQTASKTVRTTKNLQTKHHEL